MTLLASRNALPADFGRIIGLIEDGQIDTRPWITHRTRVRRPDRQFPVVHEAGNRRHQGDRRNGRVSVEPARDVRADQHAWDGRMQDVIRSCVTISLVPEARGGPFVFWDDLPPAAARRKRTGLRRRRGVSRRTGRGRPGRARRCSSDNGLTLAAVGTGAGWVRHRLHAVPARTRQSRTKASDFIRSIIDLAGPLGAPAIIGSMQGTQRRWRRSAARRVGYLAEALNALGEHARQYGVPLLFEPLNRYETNLVNTLDDGVACCGSLTTDNVRLLADLFHMNIEEADMPAAIRAGAGAIGHVHFVDSNRRPAGLGHTRFRPHRGGTARHRFRRLRFGRGAAVPESGRGGPR